METTSEIYAALTRFKLRQFRPGQEESIRAAVQGRNVLSFMPTGGGKSLCYQMPGLVKNVHVLVVSPLIALMIDQVKSLRGKKFNAFVLHHQQTPDERRAVEFFYSMRATASSSFLYVSPEFLQTSEFREKYRRHFSIVAVDEAHCISTWGSSFRLDYRQIASVFDGTDVQWIACTATTDRRIEADIRKYVPLGDDVVRVAVDPYRANLQLVVEHIPPQRSTQETGKVKLLRLLQVLCDKEKRGPAIIYCSTRDGAERLCARLRQCGKVLSPHQYTVYFFHAGMDIDSKKDVYQGFKKDCRPIICATTAFGMGIDRTDVRIIAHYDLPLTLVDYAQGVGRAGRDGLPSLCVTLLSNTRRLTMEPSAVISSVSYEFVERVLHMFERQIAKLGVEKAKDYTVQKFLIQVERMVQTNDQITYKARYMEHARAAMGLLVKLGIIQRGDAGPKVIPITPGGESQRLLIEQTHMLERAAQLELRRLQQFFLAEEPDQRLLWQILQS